jgi:septal ring factor EnvC (AmiA/AmiB activator)
MNEQRLVAGLSLLFAAVWLTALPGCRHQEQSVNSTQAVETPAAKAELSASLQKEIDATRAEIAEAQQMQDKLAAEIKVLKQLQEENQAELTAHEEKVSRLETGQRR